MLGRRLSSIKHRSILAVALIMTLFGVMFTSHYILTRESLELLHSSESRTYPILQILDQSLTRLKDYQESLQAAVATNDEYAIDDAHTIGEDIQTLILKVESLDPSLRTRAAPILEQLKSYREISEDLTRRVIAKEISFSGEHPQIKSYFAIQEENFQRISGFRDEIHSFYMQEIRQTSDRGETTIFRGVVLIIVSLAIALAILVFLQTSIINPIVLLARASRKVATGDFTKLPERQGKDEVSQLTNDFNQMITALEQSSHTMQSIIEHGRRMALSPNLQRLRSALADGLAALDGRPAPHEFWLSVRSLLQGEGGDGRLLLVRPDGQLAGESCSVNDFKNRPHVAVRNHYDDSVMAVIVWTESDRNAASMKSFVEAIAIHVASALDSIQLQTAMNLVKEQSQSMRLLLENIDQGICTIDRSLRIQGLYSPFLEKIVGVKNLAGVDFFEAIIRPSVLNSEQKSIVSNILKLSFDEDMIAFDMNRHQLVRELEWLRNGRRMICEIDWIPLASPEGLTEKFMIVLRDVTPLRLLQTEAEANLKKLTLIDALLKIDADRFKRVVDDCERNLSELEEAVQSPDASGSLWPRFRRDLHTQKGNFRALGLMNLSTGLHELEDALEAYLKNPVHESYSMHHQLTTVSGELKRVSLFFYDTLRRGQGTESSQSHWTDTAMIQWLERLESSGPEKLPSELAALREQWMSHAAHGHQALVLKLEEAARLHARRQGLQKPRVVWTGDALLFRPEAFNLLLSAFHHLVGNTLDHGFANAKDGTEPVIRLQASVSAEGRVHLIYQDNGSGLNLAQIRSKSSTALEPDQLAELIFKQGFSVKTSVSESSGRGIGMDAVRDACHSLDGSITVRFTAPESAYGYRSFAFDITLSSSLTLSWPPSQSNLQVA